MIYCIVWISAIVLALIAYLREVYSRFSKYGVAYQKPFPFLGNMGPLIFQTHHASDDIQLCYKEHPTERYFGRFEMMKPLIIIRDLDLIKQITVKDFEHFVDRRTMVDEVADPMFGRSLFFLRGQEWRDMRSTLGPAFTSSKMRAMVPFMLDVNDQMIKALKNNILDSETGSIDVDCRDLTTRYATDVIASCAFGVKVDSYNKIQNEFYNRSKLIATSIFKRIIMYFTYSSLPRILKTLNLDLFNDKEDLEFLENLVLDTMKNRDANHIFRPDMIHLLMQAKKGKLTHDEKSQNDDAGFATAEESVYDQRTVNTNWSDVDLVAQAVLFLIAGFETASTTMCFLLHELALNPHVQDLLVKEIREHDAKNNGKLDFTTIQKMKYLDMVISEVLRLWPPVIVLDRNCVKDYNLGKPNDKATTTYTIRKGEPLTIPVWCLHRNPEYFENPDKFIPERFSDENKHKIKPFSYLPFGYGPRNCQGSRFALCEVKVMTYHLLLHFELSPSKKTMIQGKLSPKHLTLSLEGGHWVRLAQRN